MGGYFLAAEVNRPDLQEKFSKILEDGKIMALYDYLSTLITSTIGPAKTDKVPNYIVKNTKISLYATEGMRTFRDTNNAAANKIIKECRTILQFSKYRPGDCLIISGNLEAAGAWIDANTYGVEVEKNIGNYGIFEIGGASIQIVGNNDNRISFKGWGKDATVRKLCRPGETVKQFKAANTLWNGGFTAAQDAHKKGAWDNLLDTFRKKCRDIPPEWTKIRERMEVRPYKLAGIFQFFNRFWGTGSRGSNEIKPERNFFDEIKRIGKREFEKPANKRNIPETKFGDHVDVPFCAAYVTYLSEALRFEGMISSKETTADCKVEWVRGLAKFKEFDVNRDFEP